MAICEQCGATSNEVINFCKICGAPADGFTPVVKLPANYQTLSAGTKSNNNNLVIGVLIGLLVAMGLGGAYVMGKGERGDGLETSAKTAPTATTGAAGASTTVVSTPYVDSFLSGPVTQYTSSTANERDRPAPNGASRILRSYAAGTILQGQWVKGVTSGTRWLKTPSGYVYEGNLTSSALATSEYVDRYISDYQIAIVTGKAHERSLPGPKDGHVLTSYSSGAELYGRWVAGITPGTRWFKTDTGYVWEGNLVRN